MATTLQHQHACNRSSGPDDPAPTVFRNDANNITALQRARLQQKLAEEAARRHKEQLDAAAKSLAGEVKDREKVQKERDALRGDYNALNQTIQARDGELVGAKKEIETLREDKRLSEISKCRKEAELASANSAKQQADNLRAQREKELEAANNDKTMLQNQVNLLSNRVNKMEHALPNLSRQDNCLPFQYHNSTVMIVNFACMVALDSGKANGLAHGWEYFLWSENQTFTLTKYGTGPNDYWIIARKKDGKRLYFPAGNTGVELAVGNAPDKQDYWYIGRGSDSRVGSWVIKNVEWGTYMEIENGLKANGTRILSQDDSDRHTANWVIIPLAFDNQHL
ncbi:hypothetical protein ACJ41O_010755 [Fusarium nematophilum]